MKKAAIIFLITLFSLALGASASYIFHEEINTLIAEDTFTIDKNFDDLIYANLDQDPEEEAVLYYAIPAFSGNSDIAVEKIIEVYDIQDDNWVLVEEVREGHKKSDDGKGTNHVLSPIEGFEIVDINQDSVFELFIQQKHESDLTKKLAEELTIHSQKDYKVIGYEDGKIKYLDFLTGAQHIALSSYVSLNELFVKDGKIYESFSGYCESVREPCYFFNYVVSQNNNGIWEVDYTTPIKGPGWETYENLYPEDAHWSDDREDWSGLILDFL